MRESDAYVACFSAISLNRSARQRSASACWRRFLNVRGTAHRACQCASSTSRRRWQKWQRALDGSAAALRVGGLCKTSICWTRRGGASLPVAPCIVPARSHPSLPGLLLVADGIPMDAASVVLTVAPSVATAHWSIASRNLASPHP